MTNRERADRLITEAASVSGEALGALGSSNWNLAARRAQEVVELVVRSLLNEIAVECRHGHDPVPDLVEAVRARRLDVDVGFLDWLTARSTELAELRKPAFYQEIAVSLEGARSAVATAARVLDFGRDLLGKLRP